MTLIQIMHNKLIQSNRFRAKIGVFQFLEGGTVYSYLTLYYFSSEFWISAN